VVLMAGASKPSQKVFRQSDPAEVQGHQQALISWLFLELQQTHDIRHKDGKKGRVVEVAV
jgi:hypothetical protein